VHERVDRSAVLAHLRRMPAALLYEAAGRCGDMGPDIRCMIRGARLAGIAATLRIWPGDNRGVFHAIERAQAGDVLVIDAGGSDRTTVWGGTSAIAAQARGIVGCVTNAAVRDIEELEQLALPVFAAGTCLRGATKHDPGMHGIPVTVGDVLVCSGDYVVGDADGVVVIAAARIAEVIDAARALHAKAAERDEALRAGRPATQVMNLE
jgi:4-hydroxy-4-methyl-2-oxoglutarate aldolase